ncbi:MAG: hypothetical protein ACD_21C00105G0001 [uncultured bacterium]|nr:MAG: hypothetical protein ACD_21C00105G0001 [uncultured bacterium]
MISITKLAKCFLLLIISCIPSLVFANTYSAINYTITPGFTGSVPFVKVETEIKGQLSGKVVVDFPYKWGGVDYTKQIKNFKLDHPQGKAQLKKHSAIITVPKTDSIGLAYEVHQKPGNPSNVHETIIRKDLVHAIGNGIFVIPHALQGSDKKIDFNITWNDIPKDWKTLSSHSIARSFKFVDTTSKLLHAIYVAGNLRINQIVDTESPVYLSLYGNFDLPDASITSNLREIIKAQRAFFNDYDFPYYAISIIESDDPSFGGTGLYNSFAGYLPNKTMGKYLPNKSGKFLQYIFLAHEHFHNWIGGKIHNNEQEELNYWWTEGFTDYYSRVLALRSGGISLEEFIDECNQILRAYYLSPALNAPNKRIKKDFWRNLDVQKLPYYRGFIFAIYLNYLIKKNNPDNSLDNVMLDLFKNAEHKNFSTPYFEKIVKTYVLLGVSNDVSMFINKGKTIELNGVSRFLPLEKIKMGSYYLGCNRKAFNKEHIIKKIDRRSNAYKAGLRNGDKIIEWSSMSWQSEKSPDQIITIKTADKTFEFKPESPYKKNIIYQFKPNLSQADKDKIKIFFGAK